MNVGDLLGSGTISGPTRESMGSLLEMTENGRIPLTLGPDKTTRLFLEDGDEVRISGIAGKEGALVGFGDCQAIITPALATCN
jgi:fumarylacetoacetase